MAVGPGGTTPANNSSLLFTNGEIVRIQAVPNYDERVPVTNYFVHWLAKANAVIATNTAEHTTLQITGDALVFAYFATNKNSFVVDFVTEGNGSLVDTNENASAGPRPPHPGRRRRPGLLPRPGGAGRRLRLRRPGAATGPPPPTPSSSPTSRWT